MQTQYADIAFSNVKPRAPLLETNRVVYATRPGVAHEPMYSNTSTGPYRRHAAGKQLFFHCSQIQLQFIQVH